MSEEYVHITLRQYDEFKRKSQELEDAINGMAAGRVMVAMHNDYSSLRYCWVTDQQLADEIKEIDARCCELDKRHIALLDRISRFKKLPFYKRIFSNP